MNRSKKSIFITGTDTDIGKTFVATLLVSSLKAHGYSTGYFKPVQTGTASASPSDLQTVTSLITLEPEEQTSSVYSFTEPMAPSRAARLNHEEIHIDTILKCWNKLPPRNWVVEGAGGLLVPLNSKQSIRDLVVVLEMDVVLVASTRLGTMNHILLSLEVAQASGINVLGLVLVGQEDPGLKEALEDYLQNRPQDSNKVPILAEIPWLPEITTTTVKNSCSHYFPAATLDQIFSDNPLKENDSI